MLGSCVTVKAEIVNIEAFSLHANQGEIIQWLRSAPGRPEMVYAVHGDPPAGAARRGREGSWLEGGDCAAS